MTKRPNSNIFCFLAEKPYNSHFIVAAVCEYAVCKPFACILCRVHSIIHRTGAVYDQNNVCIRLYILRHRVALNGQLYRIIAVCVRRIRHKRFCNSHFSLFTFRQRHGRHKRKHHYERKDQCK